MGVQIEIVGDGKVDGLLHPLVVRRLARQMEFADAAIVAAFEFVLHEIEDHGIAEPALDIGADAIRPDEGHDLQALGLRVHQRMRAGVRTAGGENAGDAMLLEQRQHLVELVVGLRLPIVMQMRVEDFDRLGGSALGALVAASSAHGDASDSGPHRPLRDHSPIIIRPRPRAAARPRRPPRPAARAGASGGGRCGRDRCRSPA